MKKLKGLKRLKRLKGLKGAKGGGRRGGAAIRRMDALLARYASRPGLLDALHAMAILEEGGGAEGAGEAPTLTELALAHLRATRGRGRAAPPLALGELFKRCASRYAPEQRRSLGALRGAARFFGEALGEETPVDELSAKRVAAALERFRSPETANSHFRRLRLAINWAVREGLLETSPIAGLAPRRVDWREPAWLAPERVERILRTAEAHPGPAEAGIGAFLALGFLAGVRTEEILRAKWEDLDLDGSVLRIPRPKGFTRGRRPRLVELEPSAAAWLRKWRDWTAEHRGGEATGRIVRDEHGIRDWKARRLDPADVWGGGATHNAARHTYATMHVAAFRNAAATALNLGHGRSTEMLERHYRGLVPRSVAETYWRILPAPGPLPPPEPAPGRGFRSDLHR